jgi:hypothetical protein
MKVPMLHGINHDTFGKRDPRQCACLMALRAVVSDVQAAKK